MNALLIRVFAGIGLATVSACGTKSVEGSTSVSVKFAAMVGEAPFACGRSYNGVGVDNSTMWPVDLRFYLYDVELRDKQGVYQPLQLQQSEALPYQTAQVALLDFEDRSANCESGTPSMNDRIVGDLPKASDSQAFTGLRFKVGVPQALNHANADEAADPLNNAGLGAGMQWVWLSGYKFFKLDVAASDKKDSDYSVHIGSSACTLQSDVSVCKHQNIATVELRDYQSTDDIVVLDVAAVLGDTSLGAVAERPGCHSANTATACLKTFPVFGLDTGFDDFGVPSAPARNPQGAFRVRSSR